MRGVVNMLVVVGFHYLEQGRVDEGLELLLTACEFPRRFSNDLAAIEFLTQTGCQMNALTAVLEVMSTYELSPQQLRRIDESLVRAELKREGFGRVMDTDSPSRD